MIVNQFAEKLSSAPSLRLFQQRAGESAQELLGCKSARYYIYLSSIEMLLLEGAQFPVDDSSQPGQVALWLEPCAKDLPWVGAGEHAGSISLPVRRYGELVGVLCLSSPHPEPGSADLEEFIQLIAVLQEQVETRHELTEFRDRTRDLLVLSLESLVGREGHVMRVAKLCAELSALLDLSAQLRSQLFQAAHYHDVGQLALIERSRQDSKSQHAQAGADFLNSTSGLSNLAYLVESHHERYDGSGFPKKARGDQLPIECWVLVLAEHLEEHWEVHSASSYAEKLTLFFQSEAGKHHPEVVDALSGLVDSGRLEEIMK